MKNNFLFKYIFDYFVPFYLLVLMNQSELFFNLKYNLI